jgi:hypothetical protein
MLSSLSARHIHVPAYNWLCNLMIAVLNVGKPRVRLGSVLFRVCNCNSVYAHSLNRARPINIYEYLNSYATPHCQVPTPRTR